MIVGNGLLAKAFAPQFASSPEVLVFASGVSNSRETRAEEYVHERALLAQHLEAAPRVVYFSTCSVHDPELQDSPYVQHKLAMEDLLRARVARHAILRLPQVVGTTPNPHTLTNFLAAKVRAREPFTVWTRAWRNLIDVDDVARIGAWLLARHQDGFTANIACPDSIAVPDLVRLFEQALGVAAQTSAVDAGGHYAIDTSDTQAAADALGIRFGPDYLPNLIRKYYA